MITEKLRNIVVFKVAKQKFYVAEYYTAYIFIWTNIKKQQFCSINLLFLFQVYY